MRGAEITVPPIGKDDVEKYAKKAADLGIVPNPTRRFNDAPAGRLVAVVPEPGTKVKKGTKVQLIVSAGQPQVVFTNEKDILRVNGANGQKLDPIADDDELLETNPTWNAAGTHVAYAADGRIMLKDITKDNADAVPLSPAGSDDSNLAWAPIADTNVIAFTRATAEDADLCLGKITRDGMDANCIIEPERLAQPRRPLGAGRQVDPGVRGQERPERGRDRALEAQGRQGPVLEQPVATGPRAASSPTSSGRTRS